MYELDWNVFNAHLETMVELVPILGTTGIRSTVCGPESFTPDHKPIMGESLNAKVIIVGSTICLLQYSNVNICIRKVAKN